MLDHMKQVLLTEAHRDVLDHDSCKRLNAIQDSVEVYHIVRQLCNALVLRRWLKVLVRHALLRVVVITIVWRHAKDMDLGRLGLHRWLHAHHGHIVIAYIMTHVRLVQEGRNICGAWKSVYLLSLLVFNIKILRLGWTVIFVIKRLARLLEAPL